MITCNTCGNKKETVFIYNGPEGEYLYTTERCYICEPVTEHERLLQEVGF